MYFVYGSKGIASVASAKFQGAPGVGMSQLVVEVAVATQPNDTPTPPRIVAIQGLLSIGTLVIALLQTELVDWRCFPNYSQTNQGKLRAFLAPAQVRALDEARLADGGLALDIVLVVLINGSDGLRGAQQAVQEKVTGSDWARILKEMKFEDRATFEVPIEGGRVGPPLDKAALHMRAALDKVQLRQWDDALTKCREVLTELRQFEPVPAPAVADWADKSKREAWGLLERVMAAQAAVRHMTHAGPHAAVGAVNEHEVRLVVAMTGALLRYYASR